MSFPRFAAALGALFLLSSCSRPVSTEYFIRAGQAPDSLYVFSMDLFDTLHTWDVLFYTAADDRTALPGSSRPDSVAVDLKLDIKWISPAPDTLSEVVYMPGGTPAGCAVPYRTGLCPVTPGIHTISVRVGCAPDGFRGLGVICRTVNP